MKSSCDLCSVVTFENRESFSVIWNRSTFDSNLFSNNFTELGFVVTYLIIALDIFHKMLSSDWVFCLRNIWKLLTGFFNNIHKEIFPYLLSLFLENKPVTAEKKDFFVVFYYMAAGFCSDLIKNYIDCVHSNFSSHILYSYEKPSYFTSKKLFFPLEIMKDLILGRNIYFTMIFLFQRYFF